MAGDMHGKGVCVAGGMHGRGVCMAGGHAWQGACVVGGGACMAFWRQVTMFFFVNFKNDKKLSAKKTCYRGRRGVQLLILNYRETCY